VKLLVALHIGWIIEIRNEQAFYLDLIICLGGPYIIRGWIEGIVFGKSCLSILRSVIYRKLYDIYFPKQGLF
jgi:hypothetical protein